jgi:protein-L-isoaspartate(D-aspartate) O-methyltransferase
LTLDGAAITGRRETGAKAMSDRKTEALRLQMINSQLRTCDVNDLDLLAAFAAVPRERFVAPAAAAIAYTDCEPSSAGPAGRKLLSPRTTGLLLKAADPAKGEKALSVGGGAGYTAALLAAMGLDVVALETDSSAARALSLTNVKCVEGALDAPPAGEGPFDVIVLNGAFEVAPDKLIAVLKDGGRLVGLDARSGTKRVVVFERFGEAVSRRETFDAAGDVLPGFARAPSFAF